ncbi:MAG TPA: hypothetical protein VGR05_06940 [Sphingomicrobium sp.]|nr:hypothetical protein [Sphingomicrobium sp.]
MLAFIMASMMVVANDPAPVQAASLEGQPTRYCREMGGAASRSQAILICRTRAQWARRDACDGPTRYCPPKKRVASLETAFPMNEDSRIICRQLRVTGTRLTSVKTCLPQREWDRMYANTQGDMQELQDKYSKQPRNQ